MPHETSRRKRHNNNTATLDAETSSLRKEADELEALAAAGHRKAEADARKADLNNSLGAAFGALGL